MWTAGTDPQEYAAFLLALFNAVANFIPPETYLWRKDEDIQHVGDEFYRGKTAGAAAGEIASTPRVADLTPPSFKDVTSAAAATAPGACEPALAKLLRGPIRAAGMGGASSSASDSATGGARAAWQRSSFQVVEKQQKTKWMWGVTLTGAWASKRKASDGGGIAEDTGNFMGHLLKRFWRAGGAQAGWTGISPMLDPGTASGDGEKSLDGSASLPDAHRPSANSLDRDPARKTGGKVGASVRLPSSSPAEMQQTPIPKREFKRSNSALQKVLEASRAAPRVAPHQVMHKAAFALAPTRQSSATSRIFADHTSMMRSKMGVTRAAPSSTAPREVSKPDVSKRGSKIRQPGGGVPGRGLATGTLGGGDSGGLPNAMRVG
eukprot:7376261-Prymnesium_polylepis.2